ncbi:MAG: 23S rRNA (guanosine(2251)-2'-O)-methyltransferase RlmB [Chloroflexi bacterium RBG_13_60_9]|nr:MAG: 23S rRNA (guanosine(2251)-2'-O)-methyltransferase RlmB [Chloroflexi bacterium RBG_13_60_9]
MIREWIYGRQAVREVLRAGRRPVFLLQMAASARAQETLDEILALARKKNLRVERVPPAALDKLGGNHQGVAVQAGEYPLAPIEEILTRSESAGPEALLLILDQIQDPQNMASLLRTAEAAGVDGVILPLRRAAGVTPAVVNASAGAVEHLAIAQANLAQAIEEIKRRGIWVAGLDADPAGESLLGADLTGPLALVIGSEGEGLRPLVRKSCDRLVRLPMHGRIESLNAAAAGSIALYLVLQQRMKKNAA